MNETGPNYYSNSFGGAEPDKTVTPPTIKVYIKIIDIQVQLKMLTSSKLENFGEEF